MIGRILVALIFAVVLGAISYAQQPVSVIGPITPGDCPQFNSNTVIEDSNIPCNGSGSLPLVVGITPITSGTTNNLLYDNGGVLGNTSALPNGTTATTQPAGTGGTDVATVGYVLVNAFSNSLNTQTSNYTIQSSDCGKTIQAGTGSTGFFTITIPSVSGFSGICIVAIMNGDTGRGKALSSTICGPSEILWPGQTCTIGIVNGAWGALQRPGRWKLPGGAVNFFTDFNNGSDTTGVTDGLAPGASAFKTADHCFLNAADQFDFNSVSQTQIICNMAAATDDTTGIHDPVHALTGAQGGAAFQVVGASLSISGAVSNGGACEITVPSGTSTYSLNQVVSVYGVGGATGCNGTWKVTVTDGTHLTLQSTTFGGSYTNGGTVTNGSRINASGVDGVACYFGTVVQFSNIGFLSSVNSLHAQWGCKVYLNAGNIFYGNPAGALIYTQSDAQVRIEADIGIASGATSAAILSEGNGLYAADVSYNINILPGLNPTFGAFVQSDTLGQAQFANATINLNSNTVTGTRCIANSLGYVQSGTGNANTYFPGNSNCTQSGGGVVDTTVGGTIPNASLANAATTVAGQTCTLGSTCGLSSLTNSLGSPVNLTNTGYTEGPNVAQGATGTWFASGSVAVTGTSADYIICQLWDGTTTIDSGGIQLGTSSQNSLHLSGQLASPASNLQIGCENTTANRGTMASTNGVTAKASTITAMRIN